MFSFLLVKRSSSAFFNCNAMAMRCPACAIVAGHLLASGTALLSSNSCQGVGSQAGLVPLWHGVIVEIGKAFKQEVCHMLELVYYLSQVDLSCHLNLFTFVLFWPSFCILFMVFSAGCSSIWVSSQRPSLLLPSAFRQPPAPVPPHGPCKETFLQPNALQAVVPLRCPRR